MNHPEILDSLFREAVAAIDAGDVTTLVRLLAANPRLVRDRLDSPGAWLRDKAGGALDDFFKQPYLLWFVAEDPVRNGKLPKNIAKEKQFGFILAALNGKAEALKRMIDLGVELNAPSENLYSHATALHHAMCSGSLEAVKVLVEAGAELGAKDTAWGGTPLDWVEYYIREAKGDDAGKAYPEIAAYLREIGSQP
jgi:hypothetical protein